LFGRKDYFLARFIFSKDYSLKEQIRLAIYAGRRPAEREANPPLLFQHKIQFLKGRHSPAFSLTPCAIYHRAMTGKAKMRKIIARLGLIEIALV